MSVPSYDTLMGMFYERESSIAELRQAIAAAGMELVECKGCGRPVVAIPDGLPMCEKCAVEAAEPEPDSSLVRRILLAHGHVVSECETCNFPIVDGLLKCLVCKPEPTTEDAT